MEWIAVWYFFVMVERLFENDFKNIFDYFDLQVRTKYKIDKIFIKMNKYECK